MYHKRRRRRRASSAKTTSPAAAAASRKKSASASEICDPKPEPEPMNMIHTPATIGAQHDDHDDHAGGKEAEFSESREASGSMPMTVPVSVLSPASSSSDKDNLISSTTGSVSAMLSVASAGAGAGAGLGQQIKAVGARKRKSTPMLKIENKTRISSSNGMMTPLSEDEDDEDLDDEEDDVEIDIGVDKNRNGMIQSILTELKSAKSSSGSGTGGHNNGNGTMALSLSVREQQDAVAAEDHDDEENEDVEIDEGNDHADCRQGTKTQQHNNKIGLAVGEDVESGVRLLRNRTTSAATLGQRSGSGSDPLSIVQAPRRGRKPKQQQISSTTKQIQSQRTSSSNKVRRNHRQRRRSGANNEEDEDEDSYSDDEDQDDDMEHEHEEDAHNNNVTTLGHGHGHGLGHGHGRGDDDVGEQSCTLCAYTCPDKSTMLRHMRKHSGERPFQCKLCSFGFTTKANCERHLKNRHGQIDRDQVRNLIECHLVTANANASSSMDSGSCSSGSSNDEGSHHPHPQQQQRKQMKTQSRQLQQQHGGPMSFSVKDMISNGNGNGKAAAAKSQVQAASQFAPQPGAANANSLFMPPVTAAAFASEYLNAAKSPYLLNNLHPMFLGAGVPAAAAGVDFPGLTIANAHSGPGTGAGVASEVNSKRNIFLESMTRGHPLFGVAGGAFEQLQLKNAMSAAQQNALPLVTTNHNASVAENGPLDLSMDAMDLSVKRERGSSGAASTKSSSSLSASNSNSLLKPKAVYPSDNFSTGLVTSPYVSKREPIVHPQLPVNFSAHGNTANATAADLNTMAMAGSLAVSATATAPSATGGGGLPGVGVPFPLFPFANANAAVAAAHLSGAGFPFGLRAQSDVDKFIGISLAAGGVGPTPSKNHSIPFLAASSSPASLGSIGTSTNTNSFGGSSMEIVADRDRNGSVDHLSGGTDLTPGGRRLSMGSGSAHSAVSVSVPRPGSYKSSSASPNPAVSSSRHGHGHGHKRADKRRGAGGEYQKPKQRRYRTERPFSCPHCPAKFTLRSNMERHGKHQHPNVWQRSPSNRVINRQKNLANQQNSGPSPLLSSPTLVPPSSKFSAMNGFDYSAAKLLAGAASGGLKHKASSGLDANVVNVRAVIAQQLKRKMSGTNLRMQDPDTGASDEDQDVDMDMDDSGAPGSGGVASAGAATDLASVSQLLNRAKSSNFAQYFAHAEQQSSEGGHESNSNSNGNGGGGGESETESDNRSRSSSDEHDEDQDHDHDEEDEENENENEDEHDQDEEFERAGGGKRFKYKMVNGEKKKSAYSSAPHKISCPHCTRRFPWTSSLRRHLLTHTGQKPYQCSKCPLLFTTKSNCDRHLVRKHNAKRVLAANANGSGGSGGEGDGTPIVVRGKRGRRKGRRNMQPPVIETGIMEGEAPYQLDETEIPGTEEMRTDVGCNEEDVAQNSGTSTPVTTPRSGRPPKNKPATEFFSITPKNASAAAAALNSNGSTTSPGEDVAFRCHLCDASAVERDTLLAHMEEDHKETFHLLLAKGALVNSPPSPPTDTSESEVTPPGSAGTAASTPPGTGDQKDVTHRKVMCVFCVRRFWSVEDLRRHIRSHSGERPFSCPYCSRRFTLKHSMLRHIKKHENSKSASASASALAGLNNNNELTITPVGTAPAAKRQRIGGKHSHTQAASQPSTLNFDSAGAAGSDLIGKLLGINDESLVEELLNKSDAKGAAELLGVGVSVGATASVSVVSSSTN